MIMKILIRPIFGIHEASSVLRSAEEQVVRLLKSVDDEIVRVYDLEEVLETSELSVVADLPETTRLEILKSDIRYQLIPIFFACEGVIAGKKIMDLGCGSPYTAEASLPRFFEPWLCRVLAHLGADVIGIDRYPSFNEKYRHLQRNLAHPGALADFKKDTVDLINITALLDSPSLVLDISARNLIALIRDDVKRILKQDGIVICDKTICHEFEGHLIRFPPDVD